MTPARSRRDRGRRLRFRLRPAPEQRAILTAQEWALDEEPARRRSHDRQRERRNEVREERTVRQQLVAPATPLMHLLDEGLVPEVDAVRDRAEVHHRSQAEEPAR